MLKIPVLLLCFFIQLVMHGAVYAEQQYKPFTHIILGDAATRYILNNDKEQFFEVEAIGELSASGLYIEGASLTKTFVKNYPNFSWSWRVDNIQSNADISIKGRDDYAASLHFVFGKKNLISRPKVLAYAWVGNNENIGNIISSPRAPNHFRTIILENNRSPLGVFIEYKRNLIEDFKLAYGKYPEKALSSFGLFTDNDQTAEDVKSIYRINKNI